MASTVLSDKHAEQVPAWDVQWPVRAFCAVQDAVEYFQHLLDIINRTERGAAERLGGDGVPPTAAAFTFLVSLRYSLLSY